MQNWSEYFMLLNVLFNSEECNFTGVFSKSEVCLHDYSNYKEFKLTKFQNFQQYYLHVSLSSAMLNLCIKLNKRLIQQLLGIKLCLILNNNWMLSAISVRPGSHGMILNCHKSFRLHTAIKKIKCIPVLLLKRVVCNHMAMARHHTQIDFIHKSCFL